MFTPDSLRMEKTSGGSQVKIAVANIIIPINSARESDGIRFMNNVVSTGGNQPRNKPQSAANMNAMSLFWGPVKKNEAAVVVAMNPTSQTKAERTGSPS
mmetsp:Transcript_12060/g.26654  ORF Transcript_12060/g.26654 Transcript_12060/m.26654 type:complete len:99 (+) Transcript_12060:408-704(+)